MTSKRKTWQEKLADRSGYPKVIPLQDGLPCYNAVHKMGAEVGDPVVLVNPSDVVALMRQVPLTAETAEYAEHYLKKSLRPLRSLRFVFAVDSRRLYANAHFP